MGKITKNTLFYGDNLDIIRQYIDDESIDLIYLDPPFNSNRSYNVLFKDESGIDSEAQITAFDDSWHWGDQAEETYYQLINNSSPEVSSMIGALRQFIGTNQMMAYLVMMTIRLSELHRVLKNTGSLYLHCDPTASHYLKIILDTIFSPENFINEIVWERSATRSSISKINRRAHDVILFYVKTKDYTFNMQYKQLSESSLDLYKNKDEKGFYQLVPLLVSGVRNGDTGKTWNGIDPNKQGKSGMHWVTKPENLDEYENNGLIYWPQKKNGTPRLKYYLNDSPGVPSNDIWTDVSLIPSSSKESLGYPTQKPIELLERIIQTSSNENDIVLDPFSGCGTAIAASQKLNRRWIGIDVTYLAIALHKSRLKDMYGLEVKKDYDILGDPQSLSDAKQLAQDSRYQFEWWALSLIEARPAGNKKKGSDKGIDGIISFSDEPQAEVKQILVQVKSGHVHSGLVRDFRGTIERESNAVMGIFITLESPTRDMETEAIEAGYYISPFTGQKYRKIQIITIEELLAGKNPDLPLTASFSTFKKAEKVKNGNKDVQGKLDI